jgi:DNA topoisomerase-1
VTEILDEEAAEGHGAPSSKAGTAAAKPRTASLLKSMDLDSVTLDDAIRLLTLPRTLGEIDGESVTAQNGRYGPYVKKGSDSRSLETEEQMFTITLDEARELLAQPKPRGRAARGAAAPPLRELGEDSATGRQILLREGRWGAYVTDGETNATLRKGDTVESITPQRAIELLAERRAAAPAPKRRSSSRAAGGRSAGSGRNAKSATSSARSTKSGTRSGGAGRTKKPSASDATGG